MIRIVRKISDLIKFISLELNTLSEATPRYHWKFPSKTFLITADGTDYTDFAEIFRFD